MNDLSVYLSYRCSYSYFLALALSHALREQGCDVFMDAERSDSHDAPHLEQIGARPHFLVLLTPGLIESLQQPDDALGREIDYAVEERRSVIPLLSNGFGFSGVVSDRIRLLSRDYALTVTAETVAAAAAALHERLIKAHFYGTITPVDAPKGARRKVARLHVPTADELRAEAIFNHAHSRARQDYAGKLADLDEALRLNADHVYAHFDRALARRRSGDELGALADYDDVLRLDPDAYKAYNNRAELRFAHRHYDQALADYEQATRLMPDYTMALAGKALTLHALGRIEEALGLWRPLLAHDERFDDAAWVGRELHLPPAMIDEMQHLIPHLRA